MRGGRREPYSGFQKNSLGAFPLWSKEEDTTILKNIHRPMKELVQLLPRRTARAIRARKEKLRHLTAAE